MSRKIYGNRNTVEYSRFANTQLKLQLFYMRRLQKTCKCIKLNFKEKRVRNVAIELEQIVLIQGDDFNKKYHNTSETKMIC